MLRNDSVIQDDVNRTSVTHKTKNYHNAIFFVKINVFVVAELNKF